MTKEKQNDRVSYSFGMKLSLPAKYESADFHISLTSDVNHDETPTQAFNRVKKEVLEYAREAYKSIRESEDGLDQPGNDRDVSAPAAVVEATPAQAPQVEVKALPVKARDIKVVKQQIKSAFKVLEAQKKITKDVFVTTYLQNKKVDELTDGEALRVFDSIKADFAELKL